MITGAQIRAARALLGWTSQRLADISGVHYATISRIEQVDGVPSVRVSTLAALQIAFLEAGVVFLVRDDIKGVGIRCSDGCQL